jgi:hypothetical protein
LQLKLLSLSIERVKNGAAIAITMKINVMVFCFLFLRFEFIFSYNGRRLGRRIGMLNWSLAHGDISA